MSLTLIENYEPHDKGWGIVIEPLFAQRPTTPPEEQREQEPSKASRSAGRKSRGDRGGAPTVGQSRPSRVHGLMLGARGTRYRLDMAQQADASSGHAIARLADSGEEAMRNLVALPLRMFAGALGIFEELFRTAADAVSDGDPRVVDLERRMDSLEEQVQPSRRSSAGSKK